MTVIDVTSSQTAPVTQQSAQEAGLGVLRGARARARVEKGAALRFAGEFAPPQLWSEPVPPLRATWSYLAEGEQCPEEGIARAGARAYAALCLPVRGVLLSLDWLVQRPARLLAAATLYVLLAHTGIGSFLPAPF